MFIIDRLMQIKKMEEEKKRKKETKTTGVCCVFGHGVRSCF